MAKHVIIDGYNLLGARGQVGAGRDFDGEHMREALVRDLSVYHQRKGHAVTVVFDAWRQHGGTGHREHRAGVEVVFSRQGEQADQVIQRMVRQHSRNCVVVSSDHEVTDCAQAHGAMVIRSPEFRSMLDAALLVAARSPFKEVAEKREENPQRRQGKKGNPRKLPKALRNRNRQLREF